jgi:hypothetical protein
VDSDRQQLVGVGTDLRLPDADYRIVAATELDLAFDDRRAFEQLADAHGAALFRMRDHVEDPWRSCLMFRPAAAWSVLELAGHTFGVAGDYLALMPLDPDLDPPDARHAPASFVIAHDDPRVWESDHWKLRPHPLVRREPLRDWTWAWAQATFGPISLRIAVEQSHELDGFLETCSPMPYLRVGPGHLRLAPSSSLAHLHLVDGRLELTRGHHDPSPAAIAFDAGLLVALATGALGTIGWNLVDEDSPQLLAAGDDGPSLLAYLDPTTDEDSQRQSWKRQLVTRRHDASAAVTPGQLVETLSLFLGARAPISDHLFDAWLAALPPDSLPPHIEIQLSRTFFERFGVEWLLRRLSRTQPRLRWTTDIR